MQRRALVVGVTGIAGYNTSQALLRDHWPVVGLSRRPGNPIQGVEHVHADVLDPASVEACTSRQRHHPPVLHDVVARGDRGRQLPCQRRDARQHTLDARPRRRSSSTSSW